MVLLVVVVLGVPKIAMAGQPSVQAPTGPQSGGVFTGPYTFGTYISCTNGSNFPSSYTGNLDGVHTYAFYGSADGSLLATVNGGGMMLITSCGDPFTGPNVNVANYTIYKNTAPPPTPTPTPPPTGGPTPTPTPPPSGGSTPTPPAGSGASGSSGANGTGQAGSQTLTPTTGSVTTSEALPPSPGATPPPTGSTTPTAGGIMSNGPSTHPIETHTLAWWTGWWFWILWLGVVGLLLTTGVLGWRRSHLREHWHSFAMYWWLKLEPHVLRLKVRLRQQATVHGRHESKRRGLSAHHHTGKVLAHHHTSYPALAFLLLISGILASATSWSTQAANTTLSLTVLGPPPTVGATIDEPADGDEFTVATVTVRGTCPAGLLVEIYRNTVFAGSDTCDTGGLYAVLITLDPGSNELIARDVDALGQYGPDSAPVTVTYNPPPPPPPTPGPSPTAMPASPAGGSPTPRPVRRPSGGTTTPSPGAGPSLTSDLHFYQGVEIGEPITWQVTVGGGTTPYYFSWDAGDGTSTSHTDVAQAGPAEQTHTYTQPGMYQVTIRVRDALGREAALQLAVIVNGQAGGGVMSRPKSDAGNLVFVWPALIITSLVVASYWLGARHELSVHQSDKAGPSPQPAPGG